MQANLKIKLKNRKFRLKTDTFCLLFGLTLCFRFNLVFSGFKATYNSRKQAIRETNAHPFKFNLIKISITSYFSFYDT
jgi:hypothetical protein